MKNATRCGLDFTRLGAVCLIIAWTQATIGVADEAFRPLFNGQDLEGWVLVNTPPETWSVQDEMLVCSGKPIGEIRTDRMYQNFILEVEWRHLVPRGNAGIFVWADDITSRGVPFHRGIEVQVLENAYGNTRGYTTHGDIFPIHGAQMKPLNGRGGSRAFPVENRSKPSPQWNHYRIECNDGNITLAVNGKVVTRGEQCNPSKGYICIESEGGVVHYRNLRIRELPDTPVDEAHIATSNRGYRSIYTGLNLRGWKGYDPELWTADDWVLRYQGAENRGENSLESTMHFADYGFIVDVRPSEDAVLVGLAPHGAGRVELRCTADGALTPQVWQRLEGEVRERRLTLRRDGELLVEQVIEGSPQGPLKLTALGPVQFANLYVREIEK